MSVYCTVIIINYQTIAITIKAFDNIHTYNYESQIDMNPWQFLSFTTPFSDFDGDDMIGVSDLREVIKRLCGPEHKLSDSEIQQLVQNVLEEADLDDDGALSFAEFEHIIDKSSDFCQ